MRVWYAAYGSNTDAARFACYLGGGTPAGAASHHPGCRDATAPADDRPCTIGLPLRFGGHARSWGGGGVAFAGPAPADGTATLARAWLVTTGQLADVAAQEGGADPATTSLDAHVAIALGDGRARLPVPGYDLLVVVGTLDGVPVLTITASRPPPPAPPSAAYLGTVARGLVAAHGDADRVAKHLAAAPGAAGAWTAAAVTRLLLPASPATADAAGGPRRLRSADRSAGRGPCNIRRG